MGGAVDALFNQKKQGGAENCDYDTRGIKSPSRAAETGRKRRVQMKQLHSSILIMASSASRSYRQTPCEQGSYRFKLQ